MKPNAFKHQFRSLIGKEVFFRADNGKQTRMIVTGVTPIDGRLRLQGYNPLSKRSYQTWYDQLADR